MSWLRQQKLCCGRTGDEYQKREELYHMILRDELSALTDGVFRLCNSPRDLPPRAPLVCDPIPLAARTLAPLRRRVQEAARSVGMTEDRYDDLTTAASEAAMNAVVHGACGEARVGVTPTGTVQVWITNSGHGIPRDHLREAVLTPGYWTAGTLGEGFKMMQVVDRLWFMTGRGGTTVVLEQDQEDGLGRRGHPRSTDLGMSSRFSAT